MFEALLQKEYSGPQAIFSCNEIQLSKTVFFL